MHCPRPEHRHAILERGEIGTPQDCAILPEPDQAHLRRLPVVDAPSLGPRIGGTNIGAAIAWAGLLVGLIDFAYFSGLAILQGSTPAKTLRGIASFWLGPAASRIDGAALLGLATHFGLSLIMAAGFVLLWLKYPYVRERLLRSGAGYGAFLYAVMYWVIMPLRWPTVYPRFDGLQSVADVALHLLFGVVIAKVAARLLSRPSAPFVGVAGA